MQIPYYLVLYMQIPYYLVLYTQSVLTMWCFICKVSLLFRTSYTDSLLLSALYAKCPNCVVLYMQSESAKG